MIQRAIIHVDGPPGAGKSTFVERLLHKTDHSVVVARCRRDDARRHPREACPKTDLELRRYRKAGASAAAVFTFPSGDLAADEFFTTRLMEEYSQVVVLEGDSPLGTVDLRVHVVPPLGPGRCWSAGCVIAPRRRGTRPPRWSGCCTNPMGSSGSWNR